MWINWTDLAWTLCFRSDRVSRGPWAAVLQDRLLPWHDKSCGLLGGAAGMRDGRRHAPERGECLRAAPHRASPTGTYLHWLRHRRWRLLDWPDPLGWREHPGARWVHRLPGPVPLDRRECVRFQVSWGNSEIKGWWRKVIISCFNYTDIHIGLNSVGLSGYDWLMLSAWRATKEFSTAVNSCLHDCCKHLHAYSTCPALVVYPEVPAVALTWLSNKTRSSNTLKSLYLEFNELQWMFKPKRLTG